MKKSHKNFTDFLIIVYFPVFRILISKISTFLLASLFILLVIITLLNTLPQSNYYIATVAYESMIPTLEKGDLIVAEKQSSYQIGDIITFVNPNDPQQTMTHRIINITTKNSTDTYTTKGDHNQLPDPVLIHQSDIKGKIKQKIPYIGHFFLFLHSVIGSIILIIIPATFVLSNYISEWYERIEERYHQL